MMHDDRQNLAEFRETMRKAYRHQKAKGVVSKHDRKKLDRLFSMRPGDRVVGRDGRIMFFWRVFRRRVAIHYARQYRIGARIQLDWQHMWEWILDNWQLLSAQKHSYP